MVEAVEFGACDIWGCRHGDLLGDEYCVFGGAWALRGLLYTDSGVFNLYVLHICCDLGSFLDYRARVRYPGVLRFDS